MRHETQLEDCFWLPSVNDDRHNSIQSTLYYYLHPNSHSRSESANHFKLNIASTLTTNIIGKNVNKLYQDLKKGINL